MRAQCLCGAVSSETAENCELHACHCGGYRTQGSGASFILAARSPGITGGKHIAHCQLSEWVQRRFCKHCGARPFVQVGNDYYISAKLFADNVGFGTTSQIFIDCKALYYDLTNGTSKPTEAELLEMVGTAG